MNDQNITQLIIEARTKSGFSRKELAQRAMVSYVSLLLWESGKMLPTLPSLQLLADAMDLELIVQFKPKT